VPRLRHEHQLQTFSLFSHKKHKSSKNELAGKDPARAGNLRIERSSGNLLTSNVRRNTFVGAKMKIINAMKRSSQRVRELLETFQPIDADARVIEVGSGAHGLIFYFGSRHGVGVDPLAVSYGNLFPRWQSCAQRRRGVR
jgi:hypothetical protein